MTAFSLTLQQSRLLSFIKKRIEATGIAPSFDEMVEFMGLKSKSGVHRLITGLEERGHIVRLKFRARCISVIDHPEARADQQAAQ